KDFARGVELQRQGEHVRSLPFFRAAADVAFQEAQPHEELAKALHNASIQMGFSGHGVRYAVARSQDRARLRNEALLELDRALALEPDPREQAAMWLIRSRMLELSGYVLDARLCVERADALAPETPVIKAWHDRLDRRLQIAH